MSANQDDDLDMEQRPRLRSQAGDTAAAHRRAVVKQSYESSADVQRWLREQSLEEGVKPEFDPTLLAGRRDRLWVLSSLSHFYEEELISDVLHIAKSGKEATVYCCAAGPTTGVDLLAAKVYRPRMFRSLSNDVVYREGRQQHDQDGRVQRGERQSRSAAKKTARRRAVQVTSWIEYEFQTQQLLYAAGADVPRPLSQIGNAVLMEYIGDAEQPAPRLCDVRLEPHEAQPLFDCLMRNIALSLACDRIHGDLSAYNILYWHGVVTIIDFAQAVDPRHGPEVFTLLERDVERVCRYFARYGIVADPAELAIDLWSRYMIDEL